MIDNEKADTDPIPSVFSLAVDLPADYSDFDLIVVAASAGGLKALGSFLSGLPPYLPLPVVVVQHLCDRAVYVSHLDQILQRKSSMVVKWAEDDEKLLPGTVYLAPQNRLTIIDPDTGRLHLLSATGSQRAKPNANALFTSAARVFGSRTVAVVLSGALSDGADGSASIARAGGYVLAQVPGEAQFDSMPRAAINRTQSPFIFDAAVLARIACALTMVPGVAKWFAVGTSGIGGQYNIDFCSLSWSY